MTIESHKDILSRDGINIGYTDSCLIALLETTSLPDSSQINFIANADETVVVGDDLELDINNLSHINFLSTGLYQLFIEIDMISSTYLNGTIEFRIDYDEVPDPGFWPWCSDSLTTTWYAVQEHARTQMFSATFPPFKMTAGQWLSIQMSLSDSDTRFYSGNIYVVKIA